MILIKRNLIITNFKSYLRIHYYPNDHEPIHIHIYGDGIKSQHGIRVGLDGNPLKGESKLPIGAKKALKRLWGEILKALESFM